MRIEEIRKFRSMIRGSIGRSSEVAVPHTGNGRASDGAQREGPEARARKVRAFVRRKRREVTNVVCSRFPGNSMNTKYEVGRTVTVHVARFAQSSQTRPPYRLCISRPRAPYFFLTMMTLCYMDVYTTYIHS